MVALAVIVCYGAHVVKEELVVTRHFGFLLLVGETDGGSTAERRRILSWSR